jgi:NADH:ubiquinone oxidoreductase subunit 6 (subunit J)
LAPVVFFVAGIGAIAGAIGVVSLRNPFYNVLALVGHLISLAALFLLLRAEFVAAAQVVVYAGAVMVLYVFVVAYVGGVGEPLARGGSGLRVVAALCCGALLVELCVAILGSGLKAIDAKGAGYVPGFGSAGQIGQLFLTKFLFPFEVASILLLVAAIGAVMLARRRRGLEGQEESRDSSHLDVRRPAYSGTMAEAVGGQMEAAEPASGATTQEPQPVGTAGGGGDRLERGGW